MPLLLFKPEILSVFVYNIFLWLYVGGIRIVATWNVKARKWLEGRKNIFPEIKATVNRESKIVWVHCSSLGEFEQGQPVMEKLKERFPNTKLLVTFFSPSGYEVKKNYTGADHIFYLPMDSRKNAQRFLDLVDPTLVIFIKYDYWYHYLTEIGNRKIHCLLVSAVFRKDQSFFKWYGSLQRKMLRSFTQVFVQNEDSKKLLETIEISNCAVLGDTRFDRVAGIARKFEPIPVVEHFVGGSRCIVAGSTWKEDEQALQKAVLQLNEPSVKLIIAPHEIDAFHLQYLKKLFPTSTRFSSFIAGRQGTFESVETSTSRILIIDNIGMLSRLYKYGYIIYVGGGFTKDGVHNVLEGAVYGKPIVFGSNYEKYKEAIDLLECGGAQSFTDEPALGKIFRELLSNENEYKKRCQASGKYVQENVGATEKILNYMEENRLLTS